MPFPEHYTEAQRQYLVYRSTLISSALNNDASSTSTSPMSSQSVGHADNSRLSMTQQMISDPIDTKSILRRQLIIKRKMSAVDSAVGSISNSYTPEMFGMQPNKMLIRSTSEMPYQTGVYHVPLQHSTSFPDASYHTHMLYRGFSGDESYLAQLQSPTTSTDYLFEGGYTTLAPVRSLTFRPSQRSPVQSNESSSPVNGHSAQRNQNNNTNMGGVQYNNQFFTNQQSGHSSKTSNNETTYYPSASLSQTVPRSSSQQAVPASRPARRLSSVRRSVDGLFRDVNEIIDGEMSQDSTAPTTTCLASSSSNTNNQIVCPATVSYANNRSPASRQQSSEDSPKQTTKLTGDLGDRLPSLYGRWNQKASTVSDALQPTNLSMHHIKNESTPSSTIVNQSTSPTQTTSSHGSPYEQQSSISSSTDSIPAHPTSLLSQISHEAQDYRIRNSEKPYQVQYSISSSHPPTMQQYQAAAAAAIYAATQQNTAVESGLELMKKYGNMSNMVCLYVFSKYELVLY